MLIGLSVAVLNDRGRRRACQIGCECSSRPMRAQISPRHGVLPAQGVVALFPEKRMIRPMLIDWMMRHLVVARHQNWDICAQLRCRGS